MTATKPTAASQSCIFKVSLSVPFHQHVSHCIGIGVGPSEDAFREWLHKRMLLSQMPFLWAQVDAVELESGGDLERLMHLVAYASGCSPFRQVFWRGEEVSLPDYSERFLEGVASGEGIRSGGACSLLLAGKAVADLRLSGPQHAFPGTGGNGAPGADRQIHGTVKEAPLPWMAGLMAMFGSMRRKLAYLWMTW